MADKLASLRIAIESGDIKKAQDELVKLGNTAGKTESETKKLSSSFTSLGTILTAGAIITATKQFVQMADTMTGVQNKLRLVTKSSEELATVQNELFKIAQKTRQGFAETADTYSNFAIAMGNMGKSQKEVLRTVETINKAIAISGGTTQQAAAATMQLGQAFASGTLRGDELNSILENSKGLAQAIADGMGVPIGKLRTLGSEGKITAEILAAALEKSAKSVDEKFGKTSATVSQAMTQMENSILDMIGTTDQATGTTNGLSDAITFMAEAITDNKAGIVEFGKDTFRTMQLAGTGVMLLGTEIASFFNNIPLTVTLTIDTLTAKIENAINDMLRGTEDATNKVNGLFGGDKVSLGRVDISTSMSKDYESSAKYLADLSSDLIKTSDSLQKDIFGMTTVIKTGGGLGSGGAGAKIGATAETLEQKKAREKAEKEALKLIEDIKKAKNDALQDNADREAELYLGVYQAELDAIQFNADEEARLAIDQYNMELGQLQDLADRQAQSALTFYDMVTSETQKINDANLALFESNQGLWSDEQMQTFYQKWQESIDGVKGGYNDINDMIDKISNGGADFTQSLTGQAKNIANVSKAFKEFGKITDKYAKARVEVDKSQLTDDEKKIANKKLESSQMDDQIGAYANLAGAMSGFFEEGSKGAEAMTVVSATLGIAQGIQAIISAWGSAPFPLNVPAVTATTAAVLPMISQLTSLGGSGGSGGGSSEGFGSLSKTEQIQRKYDPMIDRLDKQIELLESIDKNGSAQALNVAQSAITFERDIRILIEDSFKSIAKGGTLDKRIGISDASSLESQTGLSLYKNGKLNKNTIRDLDSFLTFASNASQNLAYFAGKKDFERQISLDTFITNVQGVIGDFALAMGDSVSEMGDAKDTFKDIFDGITGTTYYASLDIKKAFNDVNKLIGDSDLPTYLANQITAIETVEKAFGDQIENILNTSNDFETQVNATKMLNELLGTTFKAGTAEALDYMDSIQTVGDAMVKAKEDTKSLFESIGGFIDELQNKSMKDPSMTFNTFSQSFNDMVDAISSGADNITEIGGKAIDNAKGYLDVVSATATSSRDIEFAKAMLINKFSGVVESKDITLTNINTTLNNNNAVLVGELQALKFELNSIKNMTIDQTIATQNSLISLRGILSEVSA